MSEKNRIRNLSVDIIYMNRLLQQSEQRRKQIKYNYFSPRGERKRYLL